MVPVMTKLGDVWIGFVKGLPGCASVAETPEECEEQLAEVFIARIEAEEALMRGGVICTEH